MDGSPSSKSRLPGRLWQVPLYACFVILTFLAIMTIADLMSFYPEGN